MNNHASAPAFRSALAPWIEKFIAEKQACGYKYAVEGEALGASIVSSANGDWRPPPYPGRWSSAGSRRIRMRVHGPSGRGSVWSAAWPSSSSGRVVRPTSPRPD